MTQKSQDSKVKTIVGTALPLMGLPPIVLQFARTAARIENKLVRIHAAGVSQETTDAWSKEYNGLLCFEDYLDQRFRKWQLAQGGQWMGGAEIVEWAEREESPDDLQSTH